MTLVAKRRFSTLQPSRCHRATRALAWPILVLTGLAGLLVGLAAASGIVHRVIVEGSSMEPTLAPGDRLVVVRARRLHRGDIVAVPDPRRPSRLLVKRVKSLDHDGRLVSVEGDNGDQSTDSRIFGPLSQGAVVGRVLYRYGPPARVGPVDGRR